MIMSFWFRIVENNCICVILNYVNKEAKNDIFHHMTNFYSFILAKFTEEIMN